MISKWDNELPLSIILLVDPSEKYITMLIE